MDTGRGHRLIWYWRQGVFEYVKHDHCRFLTGVFVYYLKRMSKVDAESYGLKILSAITALVSDNLETRIVSVCRGGDKGDACHQPT